jgi:hypothetical protein
VRQGLTATGVDELLLRRHRGPVPPGPIAIAWGELRDALQLDHAVRTADRALCIATLDADSMRSSLLRLLDMADEAPGAELRYRSAMALHGVLALRAVPALAGGHHLAATELLMNSPRPGGHAGRRRTPGADGAAGRPAPRRRPPGTAGGARPGAAGRRAAPRGGP